VVLGAIHYGVVCLSVVPLFLVATCPGASVETEISRERAIEIARQEVSFEPDGVEAVQALSNGRAVWRVAFRGRLPGQPVGLFETLIVEVDSSTSEVVSISRT
jgi:hypothetical protein